MFLCVPMLVRQTLYQLNCLLSLSRHDHMWERLVLTHQFLQTKTGVIYRCPVTLILSSKVPMPVPVPVPEPAPEPWIDFLCLSRCWSMPGAIWWVTRTEAISSPSERKLTVCCQHWKYHLLLLEFSRPGHLLVSLADIKGMEVPLLSKELLESVSMKSWFFSCFPINAFWGWNFMAAYEYDLISK